MVGQRPGSPAPNLSGAELSSIPASAELSVPGGRGWERGWPLVPQSEAASPEDREHRGQGPTRGHDAGHRYLLCKVALVTASTSWSFICFSRWSCSSCSLRSSCTDTLQGARHGLLQTGAPRDGQRGRGLLKGLGTRSQELSWHGALSQGIH